MRLYQPNRSLQQAQSGEDNIERKYIDRQGQANFFLLAQFTLPEMAAHAALTLFFLLSGQWLAFLLNAPLVAFNVNK